MSKLETNTIDTVSGTSTLQVGSTNTSTITLGVSGDTINVPSGVTIANSGTDTGFGGTNTPAFMAAYTGAGVTINDATDTKGTFSTEFIDVGSVYDTSTSRYTPGFVGKSFISTGLSFYSSGSKMQFARILFYKNGASLTNATDNPANDTGQIWMSSQLIVDHNATDYFEVYLRSDTSDGSTIEVPASSGNAAKPFNYFQGYKIIE
jgi:hypothetical protein